MHGMSGGRHLPLRLTEAIDFSCESKCWLLILSALIHPPQDQWCQSPLCQLLILSTSIVQSTPQDQECWSPLCWLSIASTSTVDPLCINCQSGPPRINSLNCLYIDHWSPLCWLLILSASIVDPPRINSVDRLCVDRRSPQHRPPPTDFDFLIFNIRMVVTDDHMWWRYAREVYLLNQKWIDTEEERSKKKCRKGNSYKVMVSFLLFK